jgi:pimeloyl-ACP methyl ester carboxylesterase
MKLLTALLQSLFLYLLKVAVLLVPSAYSQQTQVIQTPSMRKHLTIFALFWIIALAIICNAQQSPLPLLDAKIYDQYLGTYQLAPNEFIVIGRSERRLYSYEPQTGRVRGLNLISETNFSAGPSFLVFSPTEFEITFIKNKKGEITSLALKQPGKQDIIAKKAKFYQEEKVTFRDGDVTLAGTLLNPTTRGRHPAVILIHGSNAQDRNGYLSLIRFAADNFARHGIAAFIYDKRGVGASTGNWATAGFDDLAQDAIAALKMLQSRRDINPKQIGLWGSSQAGWVMAKATSLSNDIAFIVAVSVAGSVSVAQQNNYNIATEMRIGGFSQDDINQVIMTYNLFYDVIRAGAGGDGTKLDVAVKQAAQQNAKLKDWLPPLSSEIDWKKRDQWYLALDIDFNPVPLWEKYDGPFLGIFGELDTATPVRQVVPIFEKALASRKNKDYTIKIFPKAHHIILEAETGSDEELPRLKRYVPGYYDIMSNWILKRVNAK